MRGGGSTFLLVGVALFSNAGAADLTPIMAKECAAYTNQGRKEACLKCMKLYPEEKKAFLDLAKSRGAKAEKVALEVMNKVEADYLGGARGPGDYKDAMKIGEFGKKVDGKGKPDPKGLFDDLSLSCGKFSGRLRCVRAGHE